MMKKFTYEIFECLVAVLLFASSCTAEHFEKISETDTIKVTGRVMPFNTPDTKSTKNQQERFVSNMALFVFDSNGDKVYYSLVESAQPLFVIDRTTDPFSSHTQSLLAACKMYILANVPAADQLALENVSSESDFLSTDCTILSVPRTSDIESYGGLPMWGMIDETGSGAQIDLRSTSDALVGTVLQIPLTCMMSKLTFKITLDPVQKSDYIQRFQLTSWSVDNVPADVLTAQPTGTAQSYHHNGPFLSTATFTTVDNGVNPAMQGNATPMTFCCYVPEHRVTPSGTANYPAGITDEAKQNYKPDWLTSSDNPVKITLHGIYTDHRNLEKQVTYIIYPGANNYDDFFVDRNHEYIHNITIQGISNSKDGVGVSLDCRVDVQQNDFTFTLERETLLDSHWEIRPIRITLDPTVHPNADHIEVEIMNASSTPWIRMEMPSSGSGSVYCDVPAGSLAYGKRRYFTTDLVTNTLSANTIVSFNAGSSNSGNTNEQVIWVYIDENSDLPSSGSTTRQAQVQCRYYEKNQSVPTVTENYYFIQKSLHKITYNSHNYGIEYYEEYLYNFDAREDYGETTDGMAWGLNGKVFSSNDNAIKRNDLVVTSSSSSALDRIAEYIVDNNKSSIDSRINTAASAYGAKYDFYLDRDNNPASSEIVLHNYGGQSFTRQVAQKSLDNNWIQKSLPTNSVADGAIEYCLNKNKRDSEGHVVDVHWYLPSIDEIEDITTGGYQSFDVFQDKLYWSSQPSYKGYSFNYQGDYGFDFWFFVRIKGTATVTQSGSFYSDHPNRARATKINNLGDNVSSSSNGTWGTLYVTKDSQSSDNHTITAPVDIEPSNAYTGHEGNCLRTEVHRIRCVYSATPLNLSYQD